MTFSSVSFIFMFLPIVLLVYKLTPIKGRNIVLCIASLLFYAWGNVYHAVLFILFIILNYLFAHYISYAKEKQRRIRLVEVLVVNVSLLIYFKYYGFVLESVFAFLPHPPAYTLFSIPLGISFFIFSVTSYLIDVYRQTIPAEKNLIYFTLFVSFFPKLVMGPIERYGDMRKQFEHHPMKAVLFEQGCSKFLCGLGQKLIFANTMGVVWEMCQGNTISTLSAWLGILAYTFQIYFDFQGYTQMAIGLANMFGFQLSENFRYPYIASSITDFWRRWHITLSSWFKDYVYIPLGGNRVSLKKAIRNLLIVWCLTGLWHGSSWNFIIWGLYYGILLIIEKYILQNALKHIPTLIRWFITFVLVMIGWVFFASNTITDAIHYLSQMFMGNMYVDDLTLQIIHSYGIYFILAAVGITPVVKQMANKLQKSLADQMWYLKPVITICYVLILVSFLLANTYQAFLYFQF